MIAPAFLPTRNFEMLPEGSGETKLLDDFSLDNISKLGSKQGKSFEKQAKTMIEQKRKGDHIDATSIAKKTRVKKDEPLDGLGFLKGLVIRKHRKITKMIKGM